MGSLCSSIHLCESIQALGSSSNKSKSTIKLLLLGLDSAGKTSTVMHLLGRPIEDVVPTVGFSNVDMKQFKNFKVQIYDLGGGSRIRGIWKSYFALVHGIVFVIDSADASRVLEVKETLQDVVKNEKVSRKPILILINKQDIDGALDELDICKHIDLEALINKYKCPTKIESCTTITKPNEKFYRDPGIDRGYIWMMKFIVKNWTDLNFRVDQESQIQIEEEKKIMDERFKRFRSNVDTPEKDNEVDGDPFKPINQLIEDKTRRQSTKEEGIKTDPRGSAQGNEKGRVVLVPTSLQLKDSTKNTVPKNFDFSPTSIISEVAVRESPNIKLLNDVNKIPTKEIQVFSNPLPIINPVVNGNPQHVQFANEPKVTTKIKPSTLFNRNKVTPIPQIPSIPSIQNQ